MSYPTRRRAQEPPPLVKYLIATAKPDEVAICRLSAHTGSVEEWMRALKHADQLIEHRERRERRKLLSISAIEEPATDYLGVVRDLYSE